MKDFEDFKSFPEKRKRLNVILKEEKGDLEVLEHDD